MFDAKSILEALVRGAAPQAAPQQSGGGSGLGDILGKVLQGGGGQGGGLGDILGQLQKQLGQQADGAQAQGGGGGGLGDILGQLQQKMGQAGHSANAGTSGGAGGLGDILAQLQAKLGQGAGAAGGLGDILGQVLGQATSGVREGAGRLDHATGASEKIGQAVGQSPADILAKLQELVKQNPMAAGTAMGGAGGLVLGTQTGRAVAASVAKVGALALIGGLAYKAFQNYQGGKPLVTGVTAPEAAPKGSGFEPAAVTNESATLYIKAMIAAAAADGRIDAAEHAKVIGSLKQAGLDDGAEEFLANELNNPASIEDLASAVSTPEEAVQVYTAARIAIEPDSQAEGRFLAGLAGALGIDAKLAAHIDATTRSAAA